MAGGGGPGGRRVRAPGADRLGDGARPHGKIKVSWEASDPNDDRLRYRLEFRGADETLWKELAADETQTSWEWDTSTVPDGAYRLRVRADDGLDNPEGTSLTHSRVSPPFTVDNTDPVVESLDLTVLPAEGLRAVLEVRDAVSPITGVAYNIDGGDYRSVSASDGILDSPEERVEFSTEPLEPGEHTVVVRVTDAADNTAYAKRTVVVVGATVPTTAPTD